MGKESAKPNSLAHFVRRYRSDVIAVLAILFSVLGFLVNHADNQTSQTLAVQANQTAGEANKIATETQRAILSVDQSPTSDFHGVSQAAYIVSVVISNVGGSAGTDVVVSEDQVQDINASMNGACPSPTAQVTGTPMYLPAGRDTAYHYSVRVPSSFMSGRVVDPAENLVVFIKWIDFDGTIDEGCYNPVKKQGGGKLFINGLPYDIYSQFTNPFGQHIIPYSIPSISNATP